MRTLPRDRKLLQIAARYERYLAGGFATAAFEGQPEPERLQCRQVQDQVRWLGLLAKCSGYIAAGLGDHECDPPIRCLSNREYVITYAECRDRLFALMDAYGDALKNVWRLKDLVAEATTWQELDGLDLEEGWP